MTDREPMTLPQWIDEMISGHAGAPAGHSTQYVTEPTCREIVGLAYTSGRSDAEAERDEARAELERLRIAQTDALSAPEGRKKSELMSNLGAFLFRYADRLLFDGHGCWVWTGAQKGTGYAELYYQGKRYLMHRLTYVLAKGAIPEGLHIDHLCRVRLCINPAHLEAVTMRTNILRGIAPSAHNARKTRCPHGHEYNEANTYRWRTQRECRPCRKHRRRETRRKARAAIAQCEEGR